MRSCPQAWATQIRVAGLHIHQQRHLRPVFALFPEIRQPLHTDAACTMARNFVDQPFVGQLKLSLPPLNAKAVPLMTADQVNKIPSHLLSWIWSVASQVQDLDEITIVTVADQSCHPKIRRVVQWILRGEEATFFVKGRSEVVRMDDKNNRRVVPYDAEAHAQDMGWRATTETHAWFAEEAELYQFSTLAGLTDLQSALSKRLCSRYPVYVAEIVIFFKTLYTNDIFVSFLRSVQVR